jgi:hypothetical protein
MTAEVAQEPVQAAQGVEADRTVLATRLAPIQRDGDAECKKRGLDPELFYPPMRQRIDPRVFQACAVCQIRMLCLRAVMRIERGEPQRFGIWAGLTPRQRTNLAAGLPVKTTVPATTRNAGKLEPLLGLPS